ncbi:carboxypeptidase regulatory-like domain-containing protein [Salinispora sp. H7-4]|uniref:carboxypeptidase regulatory-like domain-containing protein n=1 Tax=Salinispora sp. H7-4 TaxID=2748321 RepID=UPI0015D273FF|nr:carboxypeptidase regulatory-like domain-containing protein [Salinispora sp. H7-4]NYT95364.1 carboxypeptidase regulatory-like domain-containing protein [Salinispora sp. H7-4]
MDVSTHRRAWKQRAGVVAALLVGALLTVPASPASAAPVVNKVSASPSRVEAGGSTTVSYSIEASADDPAIVTVTANNGKLTCTTGCEREVKQGGSFQDTFRLADDAADGEATITVTAKSNDGEGSDTTTVTLVGKPEPQPSPSQPPQPQTVKSVSGEVVNQNTGSPVPGAQVVLKDSKNNRFDTSTDNGGNFRFTGSTQNPIAPGQLDIGASIDDFAATKTLRASTGQSVSGQRISLKIEAATPSPTTSSSVEPAPTVGVEEQTDEPIEAAVDGPVADASNEESGGIGSLLIILLGGLLVAAGVGTMVLLWLRRKETDEDEADVAPSGAATGAVPVARGGYGGTDDQTRIVNPTAAAPTMVGGSPSLAEAPTMMHSPVVDDVPPDPYGAPPQPYNASAGQSSWADSGYGATSPASGGGYGATPPASGGGYGATPPASGGGYGASDYGMSSSAGTGYPPASGGSTGYDDRYDEATGRYQTAATQYPAPADPYPTGRYQQDAGYSQTEPAYGQGAQPASGYDQRGGYGGGYGYDQQGGYGGYHQEPPAQQGGYGYDQQSGYDQQGGYHQEPPAQHGGYHQETPAQQGGYGYDQQGGYDQQSGYDQQGGYHQETPAQHGGYGYDQQSGYGGYHQEPPAQHGGYDDRGYGQGGYGSGYGEPTQADRTRSDAPPPDRSGRRLDWLDD